VLQSLPGPPGCRFLPDAGGAILRRRERTRHSPATIIRRVPLLFSRLLAAASLAIAASMAAPAQTAKQLIAHRGASGSAPEHTFAAYKLAMAQHADFVEPDLGVTKDNVLICLHDDTLERTTDAAQVFAQRPSKVQMRQPGAHWLASDFTLEEVKRLD